MWKIIIQVKYQESRTECENLAYFQSIENKCKLSMTKFILVKDKLAALSKLALLPWLQIYHDNIENGKESSDSLMDVYTPCINYKPHPCEYAVPLSHIITTCESYPQCL